jgi:GntR family transcriptional regulator/MocR family aminotransferase
MLTYTFEEKKGVPLYEQLYRFIKRDICSGVLRAGEKLPSKRALARHLDLGIITVQNAYAQLAVEGYIETRERSGYFVAELSESLPPPPEPQPRPEPTRPRHEYLLDLKTNRIDVSNFPFSVWSRLMRLTLSERSSRLLDPLPHNGAQQLREAIAGHLYRFRGMSVHPDNIIVAAGTDVLYNLIIQLLGRDFIYALEDPGYNKLGLICRACGAQTAYIPLDRYGLSLRALEESGAKVAHISPAHHYPTGIVMPISRRRQLLRWADRQGGFLIEDDYDSEFRFSGRPIETMQSIDTGGRVIYINTFSKSISPSARISYMVLPDTLKDMFSEKLGFYSCTVPSIDQYSLAQFIDGGYFEQHLARMKTYYKNLRGQVIAAIDELPFRKKLTISEQHSGLHFLLKVSTSLSDEDLIACAEALGVRISCLSQMTHRGDERRFDHTLIVNYSGVTPEQLEHFIELMRTIKESGIF